MQIALIFQNWHGAILGGFILFFYPLPFIEVLKLPVLQSVNEFGSWRGGLEGWVSYDAERLSYDFHIICICMTARDDKEDFLIYLFFAVTKLPGDSVDLILRRLLHTSHSAR